MAGYTDSAMRALCIEQGADLTFTEMISAAGLSHNNKNTHNMLKTKYPCAVQLFGKDAQILSETAKKLSDDKNILAVDLNMGCPAPKIVKNGEGCALMQNISLASKIIAAVRKSTALPLSVKFRSGFDAGNINACEFARMCEESGCNFITVHARTRDQFYSGHSDREIISKVKSQVKIPVVGSGDVVDYNSAKAMFEQTGADAVMIGRAAIGNPFVFAQIKAGFENKEYTPPTLEQKLGMAIKQLKMMTEIYGELTAVKNFRKHAAHYLNGMKHAAKLRRELNLLTVADEIYKLFNNI